MLLTVVTWNMHAGRGDLPRLIDDLNTGRLTGAPVRDYVLLLQEAVQGSLNDVETVTRGTQLSAYFSSVRSIAAGESGNAVVSTLPLVEPRVVALPQERQPRGAIVTAVDVGGERLAIVCAHLENRESWLRGGIFSDRPRGRQAGALLNALPPVGHAIAGGDFNSLLGPNEEALRLFARRFKTTPTPRPPPQPTFHGRLILDHLFFDLPEAWEARSWVSRDTYGSDHNPVVGLVIRQ